MIIKDANASVIIGTPLMVPQAPTMSSLPFTSDQLPTIHLKHPIPIVFIRLHPSHALAPKGLT